MFEFRVSCVRCVEVVLIRTGSVLAHRLKFVFLVGLLATCFAQGMGEPFSAESTVIANSLAVRLLTVIKARDFVKASTMFHYPPGQSASERAADRASIARWLSALSAQLGDLESFRAQPTSQIEQVISISIAGGDVAYWSTLGALEIQAHRFNAAFEKENDARLVVRIMHTDDKPEIQSFHFGVPSIRPNAQAFMTDLARKLLPGI